jgi:hypothetical protein
MIVTCAVEDEENDVSIFQAADRDENCSMNTFAIF